MDKLAIARIFTWLSYIALISTLTINGVQRAMPWPVLAFTLVPLLIFLPGIIRQRYRSLSMLCFVCLMYFTLITVNLFNPEHTVLDVLEMIEVTILFVSAMFFSRWQQHKLHLNTTRD